MKKKTYYTMVFNPFTLQYEWQYQHTPNSLPVDVFQNNPQRKLWLINSLQDNNGALKLAINEILHYYYGSGEDNENLIPHNIPRHCGIDIQYEISNYLLENEVWCKLLNTEPLHICYQEFVNPLRNLISNLFSKIENQNKIPCIGDRS